VKEFGLFREFSLSSPSLDGLYYPNPYMAT
jgi:hypothetical protein